MDIKSKILPEATASQNLKVPDQEQWVKSQSQHLQVKESSQVKPTRPRSGPKVEISKSQIQTKNSQVNSQVLTKSARSSLSPKLCITIKIYLEYQR